MTEDTQPSPTRLWVITIVAVLAAAAPHLFFAPPLQLHMEGQMQAWLGIAVWAPAVLAGIAFFFGVEFGSHHEERASSFDRNTAAAVVMCSLIAWLALAATLDVNRWSDMAHMRPWEELKVMLPLFGALGALRAIFWQGFVQHLVLEDMPSPQRVGVLAALEAVVVLAFVVSTDPGAVMSSLLPLALGEAVLGAVSYELGYRVRVTMLLRAVCGVGFVWFQQAMLL